MLHPLFQEVELGLVTGRKQRAFRKWYRWGFRDVIRHHPLQDGVLAELECGILAREKSVISETGGFELWTIGTEHGPDEVELVLRAAEAFDG